MDEFFSTTIHAQNKQIAWEYSKLSEVCFSGGMFIASFCLVLSELYFPNIVIFLHFRMRTINILQSRTIVTILTITWAKLSPIVCHRRQICTDKNTPTHTRSLAQYYNICSPKMQMWFSLFVNRIMCFTFSIRVYVWVLAWVRVQYPWKPSKYIDS